MCVRGGQGVKDIYGYLPLPKTSLKTHPHPHAELGSISQNIVNYR
jgi:hypothetical protein